MACSFTGGENNCVILFGLIFTVAGLFLLALGIKQYRASVESKNWPFVEGSVTNATMEVTRSRGGATRYCPRVTYTYSVSGQSYTSKQIAIGSDWWTSSLAEVQTRLQKYPQGQPVTVYYNPRKPAEVTLEPGVSRGARATLIMGIAFSVIGGFVLLAGLIMPAGTLQ